MVAPAATAKTALQGKLARLSQSMGRTAYSFLGAPTTAIKMDRAVRVELGQIPLLILAAAALLYTRAEEASKAHGDTNKPAKLLGESALSWAIINHTAGVFPLLGIVTGAYKMGGKANTQAKIEEGVEVASTMLTGFVGALMGMGYSLASQETDARLFQLLLNGAPDLKGLISEDDVKKLFSDEHLSKVVGEMADAATQKEVTLKMKKLGNSIKHLGKLLNEYEASLGGSLAPTKDVFMGPKTPEIVTESLTKSREIAFLNRQARIGRLEKMLDVVYQRTLQYMSPEKLEKFLEGQEKPVANRVKYFVHRLQTSRQAYVKLARWGNPIFGYLIMSAFVGVPLARIVNNLLRNNFPSLQKSKGPTLLPQKPLWLKHIPGLDSAHGGHNQPSGVYPSGVYFGPTGQTIH